VARPAPGRRRNNWGFHRLDADAAGFVVRRAGIRPGDLVVDLGAGHGALTSALLAAGARVVAVELHAARAAALGDRYARDPVTVVRADVTTVALPRRPFRVVANPPWAVAESVRAHLLRSPALVRADLVLPRWLVHRWARRSTRVEVGTSLRAESFDPPAPTGTAVAILHGRATPNCPSISARSGRDRRTERLNRGSR
jgi:23S rRNA (adenine-N6)-dimethyltransferase